MHHAHRVTPESSVCKPSWFMLMKVTHSPTAAKPRPADKREHDTLYSARTGRQATSMAKMPHARQHARHAALLANLDRLLIALGSAWMNQALHTCVNEQLGAICKREERVGCGHRHA